MKILGLDYGGVIIREKQPGVEYVREYMPDAVRVINRLRYDKIFDEIYIVSRVFEGGNIRALEWLDEHDFWATGVKRENYHYCYKRHEKAPICAELGITHFVDNRLEVLNYMGTVPNRFCLAPSDRELLTFGGTLNQKGLTVVERWDQIETILLAEKAIEEQPPRKG
jgi:hypothetical protein